MKDETTWNMMEREPCVSAKKCAHLVNQTVRVLNVLFPAVDVLRSVRRSRIRLISISSTMGDHKGLSLDYVRHDASTSLD